MYDLQDDNDNEETKELTDRLEASYLNQILLDAIPYPALLVRNDRVIIAANKAAMQEGTVVGGYCCSNWSEYLESNQRVNIRKRLGNKYWDLYWVPIQGKDIFLHYAVDITEQKKREAEIRYACYHDNLTGLYNRTYFEEELNRIDEEGRLPNSVIVGDVKGLKSAN